MNQHPNGSSFINVAFDGLLIDMDGTLVDTTEAVVKHWHDVGKEIGVDPGVILKISHGRRSLDVLQILAPAKTNWEYKLNLQIFTGFFSLFAFCKSCRRSRVLSNHGDLASLLPGAATLMEALTDHSCKWAIVISSSLPLVNASRWFKKLKLPLPPFDRVITAEMVNNGKPDPACYHLDRQCLDLAQDSTELLVIEDSPAGIKAGKDAGCKVIGFLTTHSYDEIAASCPNWIIKDLKIRDLT